MQRQTRNGSPATLPAAAAAKRSHASETTEGPCCPVSRECRPSRKASRGSGRVYCTVVARHGRRFERFYASGDGAIGCGGRLLAFRCRHGFGCLWKSSRLGGRCDGPRSPPVYNLASRRSYRWGRLHHRMHSTRGMAFFVKGGAGLGLDACVTRGY